MDPSAPQHDVLPAELQRRRIMIVGDIHGCADEFRDLLDEFREPDDVLICVGDLVNKGPKNAEVVPLARGLGAFAVCGNHELAVLRGWTARQARPDAEPHFAWTDAMHTDDVEYIRQLPYTISLPLHGAVVVHAGLIPGVPLEEQTPFNMVAMRNITVATKGNGKGNGGGNSKYGYTALEGEAPGADAWAPLYRGHAGHVFFGHDAKRQLQLCPHATGLDTGCLYGNRLTAAILELGKPTRLVSVQARRAYVDTGAPPMPPHQKPPKNFSRRGVSTVTARRFSSVAAAIEPRSSTCCSLLGLAAGLGVGLVAASRWADGGSSAQAQAAAER